MGDVKSMSPKESCRQSDSCLLTQDNFKASLPPAAFPARQSLIQKLASSIRPIINT